MSSGSGLFSAEMELTQKDLGVPVHEVSVENQAFKQARTRIAKSRSVKSDLQSSEVGKLRSKH